MKKITKKLLFLMTVVMLCFAVSMCASALEETGQCGDNVYWSYDSTTKELVISGTGDMYNYRDENKMSFYQSDIETVVIEEGVTSIGFTLFMQCPNLTDVSIPDSVTAIANYAFMDCDSLTEITIPDSVAEIGMYAFANNKNLTSVKLPESLTVISNGLFSCCENLKNLTIPESVEVIAPHAFQYCLSLETIDLPDIITEIYGYTFAGCTGLESIVIPDSVTWIGEEAFWCCKNLKDVTLPANLVRIESRAFMGCASLENIVIPENVEEIQYETFSLCTALKTVNIPEKITNIQEQTFYMCTSLEEIIIPENVTVIEEKAFNTCLSLENVSCYNKNVAFNGDNIFYNEFEFVDETSEEQFMEAMKNFSFVSAKYAMMDEIGEYYDEVAEELMKAQEDLYACLIFCEEPQPNETLTLYGHEHFSTEAYAIDRNLAFDVLPESTHPDTYYSDEWIYDYDNSVRYRECTFTNCEKRIEEPLETTTEGDVEIIEPVDPDTNFEVDEITPTDDNYIIIDEAIDNGVIVKAFDITMKNKDGVHVQPNGTVKVKLPLDWSKKGEYKVYRVNDDGTLTDMNAYRQGSHMVFDTDHFSIYVIVDESVTEPEPEPEQPTECNCGCHTNPIVKFVLSIINMIFKLLGTEFNCSCGAVH